MSKNSLFQLITKLSLLITLTVALGVMLISPLTLAQNSTNLPNKYNFYIPFVVQSGNKVPTSQVSGSNFSYSGNLTENDQIRYGWDTVAIDLSYKSYPQAGGGWIKIFLEDENPESAILETGSSPISLKSIAPKLKSGKNKIILVFVDSSNDPAKSQSKASLTFNFETAVPKPTINLIEPAENSLLMSQFDRKFRLELGNFGLTSEVSQSLDRGILKVFVNDINTKPVAIIKKSTELESNKHIVEFSSKDFDPEINIPDSKTSKIIFVLAKSDGTNLENQLSKQMITNYSNTLKDLGLPEISFGEPKADRLDLTIDGERKFIIDIKNFDILSQLSTGNNEDKKGYLQIFIDDTPIKTIWNKKEFTLNELEYADKVSTKKQVKVQLVNKDFTKLVPEVAASLDIIYKPSLNADPDQKLDKNQTQSNWSLLNLNWSLIVGSLIAALIIGGIIALVVKG